MKIDKSKYEEILEELINNFFPSLKNKGVKIEFCENGNRGSAWVDKDSQMFIWVNLFYDFYNEFEIKGLLAHELFHITDTINWGIKWKKKFLKLCGISNCLEKYYEKFTDIQVIKKGLGNELLKNRKARESIINEHYKKRKNFYLSSDEIKKIMLKKGFDLQD